MEKGTQKQIVCKQRQNFKQSWAKKWKINVSLGNSCDFSPRKTFSNLCRHFTDEESLWPCLQPTYQAVSLSETSRAGPQGDRRGQQTRVRLSGAFKELDQEKELRVKRVFKQIQRNNLMTKTSMKHTFFLY